MKIFIYILKMCVPRKESKFPAKSAPLSLSGEAQVADMWRGRDSANRAADYALKGERGGVRGEEGFVLVTYTNWVATLEN